ncbi:peptidase S41 [Ferrigenium kumadai]|uniref:Peptidase S41 n=1 Tax=Ferrigenium kumadai TaxID=1682490 RepID=A0AAN1VZW0_9PROT|nr:S41 family peptidase [Ferrigenium kumadai]BBI98627.1 peptidase S41 [Ferrigenium kumadai]
MRLLEKTGLVGIGLVAGVAISLHFAALAEKATVATPLPVEELRAFSEVFGRIKSDYVEPVTDKKLINEAINGMLSGLDPHSAYLDAEAFKELQVGTQGEFGGLGIEVGMEDGLVKVVSPIEDTPAYHAGIKSGDLIVKLDDTLVKGMSLNDAVKRMRGKPGSKIVLTIIRKDEPKPLTITLVRAVIKVQSVKSKLAEPGYGFVRITQFQEHTGENLASALENLTKQNQAPLKGLVLDLRNDPGGLLTGAVGVSSAFLAKDALVVYTEGRTDDARMRLTASPENYLRGNGKEDYLKNLPDYIKSVPLVVLVNGGSASASEIVAGALQDHKRAVIMGTQTFGKGSVQTVLPLGNNTAIKLTTARYYTPGGRSIQAKGIVPDILVEDPSTAALDSAFRLREADLDKHLANGKEAEDKPDTTSKKVQPAPDNKGDAAKTAPAEFGSKNDYQLTQALNLLKGMRILQGK